MLIQLILYTKVVFITCFQHDALFICLLYPDSLFDWLQLLKFKEQVEIKLQSNTMRMAVLCYEKKN